MIASKEIKCLENSRVELSVKVGKEFVKKEYDELLGKYSKTAYIKGFRQGKVPVSVLERKYGDSLVKEAGFNVIEKGLEEALLDVDKRPLPYFTPELKNEETLDIALDKDIEFTVEYDTFPETELGTYKGLEIEVPEVIIADSDVDREIKKYQDQNAIVTEKKAGGKVMKDNVISIDYVEVDENDKEIEKTKREDFTFTVGTGYNFYKLDDDVLGFKKDEERIIEKEYAPDFEFKDLAGRKIRIKVKVTSIKTKKLPEVNDELAQDINEKFKTVDDLIADIKKRLNGVTDMKKDEEKKKLLMAQIIETTKVDPPRSMIDNQLDTMWTNFVYRFGGDEKKVEELVIAEGKTKDDLRKEWEPEALRAVKTQLIISKISKEEKIDTTAEELDKEMEDQALRSGMPLDEFKAYISENNMNEYIKIGLLEKKTYDFLLANAVVKKGAEIKYLDYLHKK
ncbi:MAG: trigger factor [Spirochaetia bacterium]|nr:trigger factor [Spirochaetia bacterium]